MRVLSRSPRGPCVRRFRLPALKWLHANGCHVEWGEALTQASEGRCIEVKVAAWLKSIRGQDADTDNDTSGDEAEE